MSGPLEELRAADKRLSALEARSADAKAVGVAEWVEAERAVRVAARRLLAASGTGEGPADERVTIDPRCTGWPNEERFCPNTCAKRGVACVAPAPTPPDAGTGTPSDDGRVLVDRSLVDAVLATKADRDAQPDWDGRDETVDAWAEIAARTTAAHMEAVKALTDSLTPAAPSGTTGVTRHNVHCGNGSLHEPHDRCNGAAQRWVKCDCLPHRCHHLDGGYFVDLPTTGATTGDES